MRNLVIRLSRTGIWKRPTYNVVVASSHRRIPGANFEKLGFYSVSSLNKCFFINLYRLSYWLLRGALISPRVGFLLGKLLAKRRIQCVLKENH